MLELKIELKFLSDSLISSGNGFGAIVDSDIVFDEYGLPFIPAKRIKGCLKESAEQIESFQKGLGINSVDTFGEEGQTSETGVYFSSLKLKEYDSIQPWIEYLSNNDKYSNLFGKNQILDHFTYYRMQTKIDSEKQTAEETSLRTSRVLAAKSNPDIFEGSIFISNHDKVESIKKTLEIAAKNLKHIGLMRNRGFGNVEVTIKENGKEPSL